MRSSSSISDWMPRVERCRTIGTSCSAGQFLFCTMASPTPGLSARFFAAYEKSAGIACSRLRASTKDSTGCERIASCAREETISSASWASTARISARSAGARCAPPAQTAILRSRVARPWRKSSRTSGLRVSTGRLPQILLVKHHCTGTTGRPGARQGLAVQFQQHGGEIPRGHHELLIRAKVASDIGGQLGVEKDLVVREDGHASGALLGSAVGSIAAPRMSGSIEKSNDQKKYDEDGDSRKPLRWRRDALLKFSRHGGRFFGAGQVVLAEERFFIKAQIARDGAHKAVAKDAAGELVPIFIFEGPDEAGADARGLGELVHGDLAQFPFALQTLAKISPGHEPQPVPSE